MTDSIHLSGASVHARTASDVSLPDCQCRTYLPADGVNSDCPRIDDATIPSPAVSFVRSHHPSLASKVSARSVRLFTSTPECLRPPLARAYMCSLTPGGKSIGILVTHKYRTKAPARSPGRRYGVFVLSVRAITYVLAVDQVGCLRRAFPRTSVR